MNSLENKFSVLPSLTLTAPKLKLLHNHVLLEDMHDLAWNENINGFKLFLLFHYMNLRFAENIDNAIFISLLQPIDNDIRNILLRGLGSERNRGKFKWEFFVLRLENNGAWRRRNHIRKWICYWDKILGIIFKEELKIKVLKFSECKGWMTRTKTYQLSKY